MEEEAARGRLVPLPLLRREVSRGALLVCVSVCLGSRRVLTWAFGWACVLALSSLAGGGGGGGGTEDGMYTELWNLCAGPLVTVPRVGDKVYYFPQGHIEQVSCPIRVSSSGRLFRLYDFASGLPFRAVVSRFRCVWRLR